MIILSSELNIRFTSSVKNLYFFSVLMFIISIKVFSPHDRFHLSPIQTTISSVSIKISILSNFLFFNGNITLHLSSKPSL